MNHANLPEISALIPHAGTMCLNERIVDWSDERIRLATATHRHPDNPLRRDGRLHALHLAEYGAQAMAVHGGLLAHRDGRRAAPGLLVSLRGVTLACEWVHALDGELIVEAERLMGSEASWQYAFRVRHGDAVIAEGRAAVIARPESVGSHSGVSE